MTSQILEITLADVENSVFASIEEVSKDKNWEPVPPFNTRYEGRLESCLAVPFQEFAGFSPYEGLIEKAAILFYTLTKGHCFLNGNKRIAIYSLLFFLFKNGKWLRISTDDLYNFSVGVASSEARNKEETLKTIDDIITKNIIDK